MFDLVSPSRRDVLVFLGGVASAAAAPALPFQRGVNFTAEGRGGYTAAVAGPMLRKLNGPKLVEQPDAVPLAAAEQGLRFSYT